MPLRITDLGPRRSSPPALSVVLSTYNQPEWLRKALLGYAGQSIRDFELVIADDGSGEETRAVIESLGNSYPVPLRHVWHPDNGFQKCEILNRASEAARADYLVFSDGDCIPRGDFLAVHHALREPGRFLSGGYVKLPMTTSRAIDEAAIADGSFARAAWLLDHGCAPRDVSRKLTVQGHWAWLWDQLSTAKASWNGHNASGWKSDLLRVNGFDTRMQYGGQDREFGERLENAGIRGKRIRHRAICVHLDHPRGYATEESIQRNRAIRAETRRLHSTWAVNGLVAPMQSAPATQAPAEPSRRAA